MRWERSQWREPTPVRAGEPWDEGEDKELRHAFQAGDSFSKIAKSHQRSRGAVASRLAHLGCIHLKSATANDGPQLLQNAKLPDEKLLRKKLPQAGKPWTAQEDASLREYVGCEATTEEIAQRARARRERRRGAPLQARPSSQFSTNTYKRNTFLIGHRNGDAHRLFPGIGNSMRPRCDSLTPERN